MTIIKYMSVDELQIRVAEVTSALDRANARLHRAHPSQAYNRLNDIRLAQELLFYIDDLNAEIASRPTGESHG